MVAYHKGYLLFSTIYIRQIKIMEIALILKNVVTQQSISYFRAIELGN